MNPSSQLKEKRIARLCWNDNGWIKPSGRIGKSSDRRSHEGEYGYGHEEWLFDLSKVINGFHYGFLEPIRKQQRSYAGKTFDVWLYTIDSESKKRYFVGEIENVIVIDEREASIVHDKYMSKGWSTEMEEQIRLSEANPVGFSGFKGVELFNVKFKISDLKYNKYVELPQENPVNKISRYSFAFFHPQFDFITRGDPKTFVFIPPKAAVPISKSSGKKKRPWPEPKEIEISDLHRIISERLVRHLRILYGYDNVTPEHPAGYGSNRIDIVVKKNIDLVFYEIKTYSSLQTSIREALGQIMEYGHWTDFTKAKELIIVTQVHNNYDEVSKYFKHIRKSYKLPIYYQAYDFEKDVLTEML
jgi:hypothetical protein